MLENFKIVFNYFVRVYVVIGWKVLYYWNKVEDFWWLFVFFKYFFNEEYFKRFLLKYLNNVILCIGVFGL